MVLKIDVVKQGVDTKIAGNRSPNVTQQWIHQNSDNIAGKRNADRGGSATLYRDFPRNKANLT